MVIKIFSCFGISKALAEEYLQNLQLQFPEINFSVKADILSIDITLKTKIIPLFENAIQATKTVFRNWIFSENQMTMSQVIAKLLRKNNATLAVAESCTGGLIADWLTDIDGASDYFLHSSIVYTDAIKEKVLHIPVEIIETHGAVSIETVKAMAKNIRELSQATYGLAISGIAGPTSDASEKPIGTVCIAVADETSVEADCLYFPKKQRIQMKALFATAALDCMRRKILQLPPLKLKLEIS